jgi:hypothetical protein
LVVRFGKYRAQELSTSLSDYDFGTNGFNEKQTSFMKVNEFLTVLSTVFPIFIGSIFSSVYRFRENRCTEGHTFAMGINEIIFARTAFEK